ncbi:MAG TPA: outer membrane beta-barrel protein [Planctomycetota bacterium]|nr:outer membrane beta-barrel protein [Planctomycetota bacterium]
MVRFATVAAVLALMAAPLVAQESTEQLRKELESLRREVDGLKAERAQNESKEVPGATKVGQDSMSPDGDSPVMTALKETKLSGFVDAGYEFSFNHLSVGGHATNNIGANPVRVFDNKGNSFYLNSVQLNLERLATEKMIVGYHLELAAGHDPLIYDGNNVTLREGWIQVLAPLGTGLDIRVGKQDKLAGLEVIESMDDMNYSRSILFGQAQNFSNTGIRMYYHVTDQFWAVLGFNNGPNALVSTPVADSTFSDSNHGKAVEMQFGAKPIKDLKVTATLLTGTEDNVSTKDKFYIFDVVAEWSMDKLTVALDIDNDSIQGVATDVGPTPRRAPRSGVALYGKYQVTDMFASVLRVEYYSDTNGEALHRNIGVVSDAGTGARVIEFTLTEEFKVANQLIIRVEFRHDDANNHIFDRNGNPARGDNTLGFEAIMPF